MKTKLIFGVCVVGILALGILAIRFEPKKQTLIEVELNEVQRVDGVFHINGQSTLLTGYVLEKYASGQLKSRVRVENGQLHGASEGWFTNGVMQVREYFTHNVAHGKRTKWYATGALKSEEQIVNGELEGSFLQWHENGQLAKQIPLIKGAAHGVSMAWFPSGYLKAQVTMEHGEIIKQQFFSDGERHVPPPVDITLNDQKLIPVRSNLNISVPEEAL